MEKQPQCQEVPVDPASNGSNEGIVKGIRPYLLLSGLLIAGFLLSLDVSIVATAVPAITSEFHATADVGWYGAAYPFTMCALQPASGKIVAIFNPRWTYLSYFTVFLCGSLLCGAAKTSTMFISGRAVAGIGASGVISGSLLVMTRTFPAEKHPLFIAIYVSVISVAQIAAPLLGGALTQYTTWRWCFYINLPAGAVTLGLVLLFLRHCAEAGDAQGLSVREKIRKIDIPGCVIFTGSISMCLLALHWGGDKFPWEAAIIIGLFVGSAMALGSFAAWEKYMGDDAMIPGKLFHGRSIALILVTTFLIFTSVVIPSFYLPEWFQIVKDKSPFQSGVMMLPSILTQIVGAVLFGTLVKRSRYFNPWFYAGSALMCIGSGFYTTFTTFSTSSGKWIGYQVIQGLGVGFAGQIPVLMMQTMVKNQARQVPQASSVVFFAQYFGSSTTQTIGGAIFQNVLTKQLLSHAHLDGKQVNMLLHAGNSKVREIVRQAFPDRMSSVLEAYNQAIVCTFYLAVAGSALALLTSLGIEWVDAREKAEVEPGTVDENQ